MPTTFVWPACFCVEEETAAIVETCGQFSRVDQAGCSQLWWCVGQSIAGTLSLRVQQLDVTCETKSKDNVFIKLVISVQFQVQRDNVYDAFYKLTDSRQQISSYIYDVVRTSVPKMNLDDVFENKDEIASNIKQQLLQSMSGYGFLVIHALVTDISPAANVKQAMNEINAARRMRVATAEVAEANKVTAVKAAEAEAESKFLQGQGVARQRQAMVAGLCSSVKDFGSEIGGVSSKEVMELLLMTQYFDMLRDVGGSSRNSTLFLEHSPGGIGSVSDQIKGTLNRM
uniref:Band 7 domain-containing protein n=1 Tax=Chlamydomonas euryale TaxID=1486919 RepID=A0A7R9Z7L3_9CHLO|mmetsp:Transcript_7280/g.22170  ORF Transcript_7280/g.22170 Transcript_7280/m.22170 type:complete len:285 (+) Transcript_7280:183-1037(+)